MTEIIEAKPLTNLRERYLRGDKEFRLDHQTVCFFSNEAAKAANKENYRDLTIDNKLADSIRGKESVPYSWQNIRNAWSRALKQLATYEHLKLMYQNMADQLSIETHSQVDFTFTIQRAVSRALHHQMVANLNTGSLKKLVRDQDHKLRFLLDSHNNQQTWITRARGHWFNMASANVFRKQLTGRAKGTIPRQSDLLDPLVELIPDLGLDRAIDAMTTMHIATSGPPGAAGACLAYELDSRPDWKQKIEQEMSKTELKDFLASPMKNTAMTYAFVKEVLRMWNVPMLVRNARDTIEVSEQIVEKNTQFLNSPYFVHRDPDNWEQPDEFKPERWLKEHKCPHSSKSAYVPFGWAPKSCIGAQMGTIQLLLLARLLVTEFSFECSSQEAVKVEMYALPHPINFHGHLSLISKKQ
jgi:cytochrome P450